MDGRASSGHLRRSAALKRGARLILAAKLVTACGGAPTAVAPLLLTAPGAAPAPSAVAAPTALGPCSSATASGPPLGKDAAADILDRAVVTRVELRGTSRVDASHGCKLLATIAGHALDRAKVRHDIHRLWEISEFDDIAVSREADGAGVAIVFLVRERPTVSEITYEGDANDFAKLLATPAESGARFDASEVRARREALHKAYVEHGYRSVKVEFEVQPLKENRVAVRFRVEPGPKTTIAAWRFRGNTNVTEAELRRLMTTNGGQVNAVGGVYREDIFRGDHDAIVGRYYDAGMLQAAMTSEEIATSSDGTSMTVTIGIVEGVVFKIKTLRFVGQLAGDERSYAAAFALKPGDIMRRGAILQGMERVREMHRRLGADAELVPETELDIAHATVDLTIRITAR